MRRILIISIVILLFSCKITKHATTDVKTEVLEQTEIKEQTTESKSDNSVIEIDKNESVVITTFSSPDSTGKQYIKSVAEINRNKKIVGRNNIIEETLTVKDIENKTQKTESIKITEKSKTATKRQWWIYVVTWILSVGIIVVIIFILKKYKIL